MQQYQCDECKVYYRESDLGIKGDYVLCLWCHALSPWEAPDER